MALRVRHRGANALGTLTALGAWFLPARHHWEVLAFLLRVGAASLLGELGTHRVLHQFAHLVGEGRALNLWLLPASFDGQLGTLLMWHLFTHLPIGTLLHWNKPADCLSLRLGPLSRPLASDFSFISFVHSRPLPLAELGVGL